jgi:hypothetical protein
MRHYARLLATTALGGSAIYDAPTIMVNAGVNWFTLQRSSASQAAIGPLAWPEITLPDDIWFILVNSSNQAVATPYGWTAVSIGGGTQGTGTAAAAGSTRLTLLWRRATTDQSVTPNPAVTIADSGDHQLLAGFLVRGCPPGVDPVDVAGAMSVISVATTVVGVGGINTISPNSLILAMVSKGSIGTLSWTTPGTVTNFTFEGYNVTSLGTDGGVYLASAVMPTPGAVPQFAASASVSGKQNNQMIALKPKLRTVAPTLTWTALTAQPTPDLNVSGVIQLNKDGTWQIDTSGQMGYGTWCDNPRAAGDYEVKATLWTGSTTGFGFPPFDTWIDINTNPNWGGNADSGSGYFMDFDVEIRKKGTTTTLATARFTLDVSSRTE